jgi:hypothetical protein
LEAMESTESSDQSDKTDSPRGFVICSVLSSLVQLARFSAADHRRHDGRADRLR